MPLYAGVELGGTKCVCTLARGHDQILEQVTVPTTSPDETLAAIEDTVAGWNRNEPVHALGIGSFGPIDLDRASITYGSITSTPKPGWRGADVAGRLQRALNVPTGFDTDVNGAALAELKWGAGQGLRDLAYVTVGTGVGVGLICDGKPVHGFGHPEAGHIRIARMPGDDWSGSCPFHGDCVEGLAAGPAIKARLGVEHLHDFPPDHPVWETVAWALAQLCHGLVCTAAPSTILIGGGVVTGQPHLIERTGQLLVESLAGYVSLPPGRPYVKAPGLGSQAGPLGSIALAMDAAA
ncbi:MAG TPA: ROK family protein [Sphingomicrobium sp.]|nr:ROK family protein [Sphingomicrobium sp.]